MANDSLSTNFKQMKISDIINELESHAPLSLQESYDNSGLLIGDKNNEINSCLLCIDVTNDVINEAITTKSNLIITHHPLIFGGIKKITGKNYIEQIIIKAIKNDIAIYAAHTNFDNYQYGVNYKIAKKLNLINTKILSPQKSNLSKLVTFVPIHNQEKVRQAIFDAGAGQIGNYDYCSYNLEGKGTFRASLASNPYVGTKEKIHFEPEIRIETIVPNHIINIVINEMIKAHPYEEVAYDVYPLSNENPTIGAGMIGELKDEINTELFLNKLKDIFNCEIIKYTNIIKSKIKKIAFCGGSGSFLLHDAIRNKADIFISADFKYHQFFEAEEKIIIADIGHYESEQYTKEIFYDILTKKFTNFAIQISKVNTNPIKYI